MFNLLSQLKYGRSQTSLMATYIPYSDYLAFASVDAKVPFGGLRCVDGRFNKCLGGWDDVWIECYIRNGLMWFAPGGRKDWNQHPLRIYGPPPAKVRVHRPVYGGRRRLRRRIRFPRFYARKEFSGSLFVADTRRHLPASGERLGMRTATMLHTGGE